MDMGYGHDVWYQGEEGNEVREDWEDWMRWDAVLTSEPDQGQKALLPNNGTSDPTCQDIQSFPMLLDSPRLGDTDMSISAPGYHQSKLGQYEAGAARFRVGQPELSPPPSRPSVSSDESSPWEPARSANADPTSVYSSLASPQSKQSRTVPIAPKGTPHGCYIPGPVAPASPSYSSSEPAKHDNNKKRKSLEDSTDENRRTSQMFTGRPVKKTAHNVIEKRYRMNLNEKIAALRDSVPSLRSSLQKTTTNDADMSKDNDINGEDLDGLTPAQKLNKGTVISKATEYIQHLETRNKQLNNEMKSLRARLKALEELVTRSPSASNRLSSPPWNRMTANETEPQSANMLNSAMLADEPPGAIRIPERMSRLRMHHDQPSSGQWQGGNHNQATRVRQSSAATASQPVRTSNRSGSFINKLMVGSLAGVMVVDGLSQREHKHDQSSERGLFATPAKHFRRSGQSTGESGSARMVTGTFSVQEALQTTKLLLLLAALIYLLCPFFKPSPRGKKHRPQAQVRLSAPPSLAVPVEVRRTAWLTAIHTVWVPRHSFLLEAVALGMKTLRLSLYKLIGWEAYMLLTGVTKEEEAARVKAWEIALDAQLMGGDAEITKSRLVLTLMAAGTLPDTPLMLMHKALHIRILLWELSDSGYAGASIIERFAAKLARSCWDAARKEHQVQLGRIDHGDANPELLPQHLSVMLQHDCDDVLIPEIIQRMYNLAWNRPNGETTDVDEPMDGVIEDSAIHSPLDALAAWWSCLVLRRELVRSLETPRQQEAEGVQSDLDLALAAAPPHSGVQLRALVAQAVLCEGVRHQNITAACGLLPSEQITSPVESLSRPPRPFLINEIGKTAVASDVRISLSLAMCLTIFHTSGSIPSRRRIITLLRKATVCPSNLTLLSFLAARAVLCTLSNDAQMVEEAQQYLELMACSLRIWIGSDGGRKAGISRVARERLVEECLDVSKRLVGLYKPPEHDDEDEDDGYLVLSLSEPQVKRS